LVQEGAIALLYLDGQEPDTLSDLAPFILEFTWEAEAGGFLSSRPTWSIQ
ncbi:hypothetical protein T4D_10143, partial [Trichinella pseudospiralis]